MHRGSSDGHSRTTGGNLRRGSPGGQQATSPGGQRVAGSGDPQPASNGGQPHGHMPGQPGNPGAPASRTGDSIGSAGGSAGSAGGPTGPAAEGGNATLQAIAAIFALFGALSLYAGFETLRLSGAVPMVGSGLRMLGLVVLVVGGAYLYAAYGVWTHRRRGWQAGMWLVAAGALVCLVGLLSSGSAGALVGLAFNVALGWGLHPNRNPFRDQPLQSTRRANRVGTRNTGQNGRRQTAGGATGGYASRRRGRH